MHPLGGFAEAPLSSYPSDDFLLISLPRGLKTLVDVPFLSPGWDFLKILGGIGGADQHHEGNRRIVKVTMKTM